MKVGIFTAARSEYSHLYPIMKEIKKNNNLSLKIIVSGMHLLDAFGRTVEQIENDGFTIDYKIPVPEYEDNNEYMSQIAGLITSQLGKILRKEKIDVLLLLGDRFETLAAAFAAFLFNIPICHIAGGDLSGNIDDSLRHAITKLSQIHFCLTERSKKRVLQLGEESWRVHVVGSPTIDYINIQGGLLSKEEVYKSFSLALNCSYIVLIQHSETGFNSEGAQTDQILSSLDAIKELDKETIIIYPNYDTGGSKIIKELEKLEKLSKIRIYKNLPTKTYLSLLKYCSVLIGNSSSGIIETSAFSIPAINLGSRQKNRERDRNVIDIPYDKNMIVDIVNRILTDEKYRAELSKTSKIYGDGQTAKKICKVLQTLEIDKRLLTKQFNEKI